MLNIFLMSDIPMDNLHGNDMTFPQFCLVIQECYMLCFPKGLKAHSFALLTIIARSYYDLFIAMMS